MRAMSTTTSYGEHGRVSGGREVAALPLACAQWRGSQGKLMVQRNLHVVKWWRLAMARAVTGLNGVVARRSSKIEARLSRNQSGAGTAGEGT